MMNMEKLTQTAHLMVGGDKGLLAMDESNGTCNKRFDAAGIPQTAQMRRAWRDLIVTTPGLDSCINAAILFDETIGQRTADNVPFAEALAMRGIIPGIKVDTGATDLAGRPGEKVTEGLDGLRMRLAAYAGMGARFAKWRAVIAVGRNLPGSGCVNANTHAMARYAALCQEAGIVPIVEPEILMDGDHSLEACSEATAMALESTFAALVDADVLLEGVVLKPAMVVSGLACARQASVQEVAHATITSLARHVPAAVAGIAFLSGGQTGELASARLNAINLLAKAPGVRAPWPITFSYSRAIQQPALSIWRGEAENVSAAQAALFHRANCNRAARRGEYDASMENI